MAFPALVVQSGVMSGQVTLALCARVLLLALVLTAVVKVVVENSTGAWCYASRRGMSVLGKPLAPASSQRLTALVPFRRSPSTHSGFHSCILPPRPIKTDCIRTNTLFKPPASWSAFSLLSSVWCLSRRRYLQTTRISSKTSA